MTRTLLLALAVSPYLVCAGLDAWWHERGRKVPRTEWWLHNGLALSLIAYFTSVFGGYATQAWIALGLFLPLHLYDAFGFHQHIDRRERAVHAAANLALAGFIGVWLWLDQPWS